jgi:hypothetical protein
MITLASCFGHQEPGKDLTITCNGPGPELTARGWIRGCERNPEPTQTKAQVLKKWGPPDEKHVVSGVEHWLYKDESSWGGEVAYFFVPIPFPVRKLNYRTDLTFAGDNLTLIHIRRGTRTGSICGLLPMPEYVPFYPGCSHFERDRHASDGWMIQDRSDTRVLPPGSKMFWIDDHYWLSKQDFIDSGARCATKPPIETERAAIEAHLGPLVAERALRTAASPTASAARRDHSSMCRRLLRLLAPQNDSGGGCRDLVMPPKVAGNRPCSVRNFSNRLTPPRTRPASVRPRT